MLLRTDKDTCPMVSLTLLPPSPLALAAFHVFFILLISRYFPTALGLAFLLSPPGGTEACTSVTVQLYDN